VNASEPFMRYRNMAFRNDAKTEVQYLLRDKFEENLFIAQSASGIETARVAWRLLRGTWEPGAEC